MLINLTYLKHCFYFLVELWGLVNNAGICFIGNSEMISRNDSLRIMDVNFRGPYLMCSKFLPLLRRSQGRIVNVSSNAGLAPVPLMALYCSSKSALFMYTEVLRAENECFGIKVSAIIPSGYKTGMRKKNLLSRFTISFILTKFSIRHFSNSKVITFQI